MAWTAYQFMLAITMVVTGSMNTIFTKWADRGSAIGVDPNNTEHPYSHAFVQTEFMFLGEMLCLLAFYSCYCHHYYQVKSEIIKETNNKDPDPDEVDKIAMSPRRVPTVIDGNREFNKFIFLPPAFFDMTATALMYLGLTMTYASSFQMLRGSVIVFCGIFSIMCLGHTLKSYQWFGIFVVIIGLMVVGASDMILNAETCAKKIEDVKDDFPLCNENETKIDTGEEFTPAGVLAGDLLIIIAQVFSAIQFVLEEKFVSVQKVAPLEAVGWEGVFGFTLLAIVIAFLTLIPGGSAFPGNPNGMVEDPADAFAQMGQSSQISGGLAGTTISIGVYNFAGVSVTKELSATTRTVLDCLRTLVVWLFSLTVQWQQFHYLQLVGFVILLAGTFIYNHVIEVPGVDTCFGTMCDACEYCGLCALTRACWGVCRKCDICDCCVDHIENPPDQEKGKADTPALLDGPPTGAPKSKGPPKSTQRPSRTGSTTMTATKDRSTTMTRKGSTTLNKERSMTLNKDRNPTMSKNRSPTPNKNRSARQRRPTSKKGSLRKSRSSRTGTSSLSSTKGARKK